ncbi:MAG: tetratricopeptide repeat protein [Anaerolinea sp.]|nr:tetratricopeptide repeat protein [Anaerolinea sp.]
MTEISLREYLAKLDNLLHANAADEVIHHCRHILQYFPKNVDAYRYLGRALVANGRWDEANAALQRVLSVVPDDFDAHVGLSEAFQNSDKPDDAIWHLERAFEQRPADKALLEHLRGLYRRYRGVENAKIPLTAVAVARQSIKSRSYVQAADTLRSALNRSPLRIDLRLLLAEVLWLKDARIEAAELAIDVLEKLPDCLNANRIMTELWLAEGRPTDAQRYINRIESVDPYLAVELVRKQPVDDNAFRLDELDYRRSAQSEVAAENPDWLEDIETESFPSSTAAFVTAPPPTSTGSSSGTMPPVKQTGALIDKEVPADNEWQEWVSAMLEGTPKPNEKPPMSGQDWLKSQSSLTDSAVLHTFEAKNTSELDEIDALFATGDLSDATSGFDTDDPIAWLRSAGIEVNEDEEPPQSSASLFDEDEFRPPEQNDNPVAWMDNYGGSDQFAADFGDSASDPADDFITNLAADLAEEFPDPFESNPNTSTASPVQNLFADEPSFDDWMNVPETPIAAPTEPDWQIDMDEFDDLSSPEQPKLEVSPEFPEDEPEQPLGVPGPKRGLTSMLGEATFDWNTATDAQPEDEWLAQFDDKKITASVTTTNPDWLSALNDDSVDTGEMLDMPDMDDLTWLSNEVPQSGGASDTGDSQASGSGGNAGDDFGWMSDFDEMAASEDLPIRSSDVPDWLSELEPKDEPADDELSASDADADEEFAWLEDADALDSEDDAEALPAEDVPDWMSELAPGEQPLSSVEKEVADLDWMSALDQTGASADDEDEFAPLSDNALDSAPISDIPDWLSELEPKAETPAMEALSGDAVNVSSSAAATAPADDEFAWMDEIDLEEEAAETSPDLADTISLAPDWVSELQAAAPVEIGALESGETEIEDEFAWMDEAAEEEAAAPVGDIPDWLTELAPTTPAEPEFEAAASSDEFAWMDEITAEETDGALVDAAAVNAGEDDLEWLSTDMLDDEEAAPDTAAGDEQVDWISALDEAGTIEAASLEPASVEAVSEEAAAAAEIVAELSEEEPSPAETPAEEFAWTEDEEAEFIPAAPESAAVSERIVDEVLPPDTEPWTPPEDEEAPLTWETDAELVSEFASGEAADVDVINESFETPAENAPDWLNAMVPGLDVDYTPVEEEVTEAETPEPSSTREFQWLTKVVEEESSPAPSTTYRFSKAPQWLQGLFPPPEPAASQPDTDLPDWASDDDDLPEWLRK